MSAETERNPDSYSASTAASPVDVSSPAHQNLGPITLRSVLLGLFLVVILDVVAIYVRYVYHGSLMTYSHVPMAMLIILLMAYWAPGDRRPLHLTP